MRHVYNCEIIVVGELVLGQSSLVEKNIIKDDNKSGLLWSILYICSTCIQKYGYACSIVGPKLAW